jgi:predicted kinase
MFNRVSHSKAESDELYAYLNDQTDQLLAAGQSVIFDTNFNYRKDRDYVTAIATRHGAEAIIIWMQTPLDVARERALHEHHRDHNGYDTTMTPEEFSRLTDHLEPPTDNENFIIIDGTQLDPVAVKRQLGI